MFNKIWDVGWTVGRAASVSRSSNKRAGVLSARRRPATTKTNRRQRTVIALFHYRVKWSARRSAAAAAGQPRVKRRHDCCCCNGPGMLRVLITQVQDKVPSTTSLQWTRVNNIAATGERASAYISRRPRLTAVLYIRPASTAERDSASAINLLIRDACTIPLYMLPPFTGRGW